MRVETQKGACPLCGIDYPAVPVAKGPDFEYRTTGDQEFTLARCATCGTIVLDPRPVDAAIASLYPPEYEPYHFETLSPLVKIGRDIVQKRKTRVIVKHAAPDATIVDVGCGGGALLRALRTEGSRYRLIGWDYPGPHLEALALDGFETIAAPLDSADAPTGVDIFVLNQVIEHVPYPERLVAKLVQGLKVGGYLVIETPNTRSLDARWFGRRYWGGYHIPRHMVLFDDQSLRRLIEHAGLRTVEASALASPAFWVQSGHHAAVESAVAPIARGFSLRNAPLVALVTAIDLVWSRFGPTGNQRLVAQRVS